MRFRCNVFTDFSRLVTVIQLIATGPLPTRLTLCDLSAAVGVDSFFVERTFYAIFCDISEALYRSYSGGEAAPASLHGRANRNNSSSPVNQSADGGENEPGGNPRRRNGGKTPEKNTVSQLAEYVVALAGAATRRDDCVERFICKMARFIPNFPWRGLVLMWVTLFPRWTQISVNILL